MKKSLAQKIIEGHIESGSWNPGDEAGIRIDHTLTQDATGTLSYLELEALGIKGVATKLSASYVDHNLLQTDYKNADDHRFLMTSAMRYGIYFSPPGNGVSHPVHMERFGEPGLTLLGSDSHSSTAGALAMIGIGAGGLDVALAMAGEPFFLKIPGVFGVRLTGRLRPWVSAKDVILEMLRRHGVKGGLGYIVEYYGPGVRTLSATERATITNMGAELGATTSIFPSDDRTRAYLRRQGRAKAWRPLHCDKDALYDKTDEIDLAGLEPLAALPGSPDNVVAVREIENVEAAQVIIGSSVNFSYRDLMIVARALKGRTIHPGLSLEINPGSRSALENVERAGGTRLLTHAGARINQSGCLGCIGMGQAPATGTVSVRTFPRNFAGRSGTEDDRVYLVSPETAVATAITGHLTDPRRLGPFPRVIEPKKYIYNDSIIIKPLSQKKRAKVKVIKGPNITAFPDFPPLPARFTGAVLLKMGDNITTDHILPAGNRILPFRSNIAKISEFAFERIDKTFATRCKAARGGLVVGGENYGQGSSREHAAIAPRFLGIRIKIAKSFARIHRANLINMGIVPLTFTDPGDYKKIKEGETMEFPGLSRAVKDGVEEITAILKKKKPVKVILKMDFTGRERESLLAGGLLNAVKKRRQRR